MASPVFLKPARRTQTRPPHNVRHSATPESPALLELGPLMRHTNPQQFRVHRPVQSQQDAQLAPSQHLEIARS